MNAALALGLVCAELAIVHLARHLLVRALEPNKVPIQNTIECVAIGICDLAAGQQIVLPDSLRGDVSERQSETWMCVHT